MGSDDPIDFHQEFDGTNLAMSYGRDFVHLSDGSAASPLVNANNPFGDDNGHGTHVAGVIAALSSASSAGHAYGMAGVAPNAVVIPIKVLDAGGEGDTANFIMAYSYLLSIAGETNLHVVNMSFSVTDDDSEYADDEGDLEGQAVDELDDTQDEQVDPGIIETQASDDVFEDKALKEMIEKAASQGIVTVCAAGNEGLTGETFPGDMEACVCVEALDAQGANAAFSNYNESKDISAPGEGIYSAWSTQADAYRSLSGTSQATAVVSGVMALLWGANPGLSVDRAKTAVYATAHAVSGSGQRPHIAPDNDGIYSGSRGAIDAAALSFLRGEVASIADTARCKVSPIATQQYTGKAVTPAVTVTYDGKKLSQGTDYTVTYKDNVRPGTAKVTIKGKGTYTGTLVLSFKIKMGTTKINSLTAGKKKMVVKWARQKKGKVGYQIRYSVKKSMKGAKTISIKKNAQTKKTIKKLKSGKRYYVQVRTYKKIGGKWVRSAWSAKKSAKVK